MKSSVIAAAAAALLVTSLSACEGLKDAMTAHVGTVARSGSQELSVDRMATLLVATTVPPRKDIANVLANAWVDYHLVGLDAVEGDTTLDPKTIDKAIWAALADVKARRFQEMVSKNWATPDSAAARRMYDTGEILAASHILALTRGRPESEHAQARARAAAIRAQVTSANFAAIAHQVSDDRQSAEQGGSVGVFERGQMVPEFEQALLALKPGEISAVVESQFGYHIIRRPTFDEIKNQALQASGQQAMQRAESTFVANLQKGAKLELRTDGASAAKTVIADPEGNLQNKAVLATYEGGKFTGGRFAEWLENFPPQTQIRQRLELQNAPDSVVQNFVKSFVTNELILRAADSAKAGPTAEELTMLRTMFLRARAEAWKQLGVDPATIADSVKSGSRADRERFVNARIDRYVDQVAAGQASFASIPSGLARILRNQHKATVNPAGLDLAVDKAKKQIIKADSARQAGQPNSIVPMPVPNDGSQGQQPPAP